MKKKLYCIVCLCGFIFIMLCACGKHINLIDMSTAEGDEECIANYLTVDGGAILFREINVTDIPDGPESEYEWNN